MDQDFVHARETKLLKYDVKALSCAFEPFVARVDILQIIVIEQIYAYWIFACMFQRLDRIARVSDNLAMINIPNVEIKDLEYPSTILALD